LLTERLIVGLFISRSVIVSGYIGWSSFIVIKVWSSFWKEALGLQVLIGSTQN
jgi:hypothetical protein